MADHITLECGDDTQLDVDLTFEHGTLRIAASDEFQSAAVLITLDQAARIVHTLTQAGLEHFAASLVVEPEPERDDPASCDFLYDAGGDRWGREADGTFTYPADAVGQSAAQGHWDRVTFASLVQRYGTVYPFKDGHALEPVTA